MSKLLDRDLASALVLFFIGGVSWSAMGSDMRNWLFPQVLTYMILLIGAVLVLRFVVLAVRNGTLDTLRPSPGARNVVIDVLVFCAIGLAYILVMDGLGFWLASFLMLSLASIYLTQQKTPRNLRLAVIVPLVACALAYVVFLHVFYVPLPEATWWAGVG